MKAYVMCIVYFSSNCTYIFLSHDVVKHLKDTCADKHITSTAVSAHSTSSSRNNACTNMRKTINTCKGQISTVNEAQL